MAMTMMTTLRNVRLPTATVAARRGRGRGFSFTEILFAVMVLGIGFIMIAAMFPITIRQTQASMEDSQGANEAKAAMACLSTVASDQNFPPTVPPFGNGQKPKLGNPAQVFSMTLAPYKTGSNIPILPGYMAIRGNFINPSNPRVAWVPLYRRGVHDNGTGEAVGDSYAQVFIFAIQSRNRTQYSPGVDPDPTRGRNYSDLDVPKGAVTGEVSTLEPRRLQVTLQYDAATGHGQLKILDALSRDWAAPGAYIVIADDPNTNAPLNRPGQSNGRIYQLGTLIDSDNGLWELAPGMDMIRTGTDPTKPQVGDDNDLLPTSTTIAYMIGRGYNDPNDATQGYGGPVQDIAIYTGYIQIPPDVKP